MAGLLGVLNVVYRQPSGISSLLFERYESIWSFRVCRKVYNTISILQGGEMTSVFYCEILNPTNAIECLPDIRTFHCGDMHRTYQANVIFSLLAARG